MLSLDATYRRFYKMKHGFSANLLTSGKLKLPFKQSYINQRAMGYGDHYMDGLEYYVVDGVASVLAKAGLNKKVLHFKIPMPFKWNEIPYVPFISEIEALTGPTKKCLSFLEFYFLKFLHTHQHQIYFFLK